VPKISKILVANRAEIACRVIRTCKKLGIKSVAVYSEADSDSPHVKLADQSFCLGAPEAKDSYLSIEKIIKACLELGADAVHPGYGFLSENAEFAAALSKNKIRFIGPRPETITLMGDKIEAKELALKCKVPLIPGLPAMDASEKSLQAIDQFAAKLKYPILIKAAAGGGGRGMRKVYSKAELPEKLASASREAESFFKDGRVFVEKLVENARHIEVQIFGDSHGDAIHLYDRDCSMQRNHQKVIEEAPAPNITAKTRKAIYEAALSLAKASKYEGAGTVEFLLDQNENFYFLEVNSRLQVEHPVTEEITGLDLVELQIRIAEGKKLSDLSIKLPELPGKLSAIEARVCAESPEENFQSATGKIERLRFGSSADLRVDLGYAEKGRVTHYYDSLLAKAISKADSRQKAIEILSSSLKAFQIFGIKNNLGFLIRLLETEQFRDVSHHIALADELLPKPEEKLALAELLSGLIEIYHLKTKQKALDPWARASLFRIRGEANLLAAFSLNGDSAKVSIKAFEDKSYQILGTQRFEIKNPEMLVDVLHFELHSKKHHFTIFEQTRNSIWIGSSFGCYHLLRFLPKLKADSSQDASHPTELSSALPGKIVAVKVKLGQKVAPGDILLVIESMKMEHNLRAPSDAEVTELSVQANEVVEAGRVLVRLGYL